MNQRTVKLLRRYSANRRLYRWLKRLYTKSTNEQRQALKVELERSLTKEQNNKVNKLGQ